MDRATFEAKLKAEGYGEIVERVFDAGKTTPEHTHPFDAHALILEGEITVTWASGSTTCKPGETFSLNAGIPHFEIYGPQGTKALVGRRMKASAAA